MDENRKPIWRRIIWQPGPACSLTILLFLFHSVVLAQETYTNAACRAVTSRMGACAKRWDSIREACTSSNTATTVWPGPCQCNYFANDLPCFDEQEFCAAQVWTQVPQWFRDGVTSCLMKDASFTVRAQLGTALGKFGNPFTISGLAGNATKTASVTATFTTARPGGGLPTSTSTSTEATPSEPTFSSGAKAGFGVGIGVGVILIIVMAMLTVRDRRKAVPVKDIEAKPMPPVELHDDHPHVPQISSTSIYPKNELLGSLPTRHELGGRTSTFVMELPDKHSGRQSRH